MKAMVLAAGLGTRLRPLTDDCPKALVTVAGRTLLEITLARLRHYGMHEVIINTHHHANKIVEYLEKHKNFGMRIEISHEPQLLDTGGGLKKAAAFFLDSNQDREEPFVLHNVDILSSIDLAAMMHFHKEQKSLATLAVQHRTTSRYLLFDDQMQLCGRQNGRDGKRERIKAATETQLLAFSGIHILSPELLMKMEGVGSFSIIDSYLQLAAQGERIIAYPTDDCYWRDLGRVESIDSAVDDINQGKFALL